MSIRAPYGEWPRLNASMTEAIAPLSDEDLAQTAGPDRWSLWAVVGHLACQRVFWLCDFAGEPGADATPFTNAAWSCPGDEDLDNVLNADQLVHALTSTFAIVDRVLETWTLESLDQEIDRSDLEPEWVHTRGFVVERVHAHDLWHAAEANEILTRIGRAPIDPWGA
jgi:uncharacterized damage-inducible protein DinB